MLLGILKNLLDTAWSSRIMSGVFDVESRGADKRVLKRFGPLIAASSWFKVHLLAPAATGTPHQHLWRWCTGSNRLEMIVVFLFWSLCIILCAVGYYTVPGGNTMLVLPRPYLLNGWN